MTAEKSTSTELLELIRHCERSAENMIRKKHFQELVGAVIQKMRPALLIEDNALDALQVKETYRHIQMYR